MTHEAFLADHQKRLAALVAKLDAEDWAWDYTDPVRKAIIGLIDDALADAFYRGQEHPHTEPPRA
jgi:hypothetical protein